MEKVLQLLNYLITVELFLCFLITSSVEDLSLPPVTCAPLGVLRSLAMFTCRGNLGGVKG